MTKYILVCGGVISGIGKGVIASSTGLLLKTTGLKVTSVKIDPYMNIDAGTMAPTEHGEVYVLNDGGEVDLDLGNYERYLDVTLSKNHNLTTGKVYQRVIEKERRGDYLGKTVQIVPHLTNEIQEWIENVAAQPVDETAEKPDVCIIELGGTVGDIESAPFVEAMSQFQERVGVENFAVALVTLIPVVGGEQKTKPTQSTVKALRNAGLFPDIIACRCEVELESDTKRKVASTCKVASNQVFGVHNVSSTYHVPLLLRDQGLVTYLQKRLSLDQIDLGPDGKKRGDSLLGRWTELTSGHDRRFDSVKIVLVGKYTSLQDSYMSVVKSLEHASMRCGRKLKLQWVESSHLEPNVQTEDPVKYHDAWKALCSAEGIMVPGGFGIRGTEGMIVAAKWAREHKVPYLGICLGLQIAVIEWARHVCGIKDAGSAELTPDTLNPAVIFMPEISKTHLGGTMRLGLRPTMFEPKTEDSKIRRLYGGKSAVWERHRHRYEVNPKMVPTFEKARDKDGEQLKFLGRDETGQRMQIIEMTGHPYFVGLQAHPEFCSRPLNPSPPFLGFIAAASGSECLEEQLARNEREFRPPHPESAMKLKAVDPAVVKATKAEAAVANGEIDA
ncbi:ctp synthase [Phaffia rhodozyma]|uniref:CTP synthase n=1 Tax=Phaffia rhodozyma TaxID=264483 RepID=A0A0F7SNE7_PHARH|nr:ctp synthase [Phaffia rhodozyma]